MILADTLQKAFSIFRKKPEVEAGAEIATAITVAGDAAAVAITASGPAVAAALTPIGPAFAAVGTTVAGQLVTSGGIVANALIAAGVQAAAAIGTANGVGAIGGGSASGNIFNRGMMMAFAAGGVVTRPTAFGMQNNRTGLMGEAGPEAIMPLSRNSSGELGVKASQPNINFNPQMKLVIVRDEKEAQLETMRSAAGEKIIVQKVARNRNVLG